MKEIVVNVVDFEGNKTVLSPSGATSDAVEEHSIWSYIPDKEEIKNTYGKGIEYLSYISIWDWNTGEMISEYNI